jgi:hypothetical protein
VARPRQHESRRNAEIASKKIITRTQTHGTRSLRFLWRILLLFLAEAEGEKGNDQEEGRKTAAASSNVLRRVWVSPAGTVVWRARVVTVAVAAMTRRAAIAGIGDMEGAVGGERESSRGAKADGGTGVGTGGFCRQFFPANL